MSNDNHSQTLRRQQEYFQEYWQDATIVFSEEVILHPREQSQQQPKESQKARKKRKKKKSKKTQKELTKTTTETSIQIQSGIELHNQERMVPTKITKKRKQRIISTGGVTTSLSEMSLVQPSTKRTRTTTDVVHQSKPNMTAIDSNSSTNKPDYLHVPDYIFKKMLSNALEGTETSMISLLDTSEKLEYARIYAQLVNDLFYLRLKEDYWKYYMTMMISFKLDSIDLSFKSMIKKQYNLHRIQFVTKENILKRQQNITEQLKQIEHKLDEHKQQAMTVDLHQLSTIIPAFVRKGQRKLFADFERKKLLLQYDMNDYHLLEEFYNLKPSNDQITSIKAIWQATIDKQHNEEYLAILKQRIYTKRLPSSFNLLDHSIDKFMSKILDKNSPVHLDKLANWSSQCERLTCRFKHDLMAIHIHLAEEISRSYDNIIANEKKKLTTNDTIVYDGHVPLSKLLVNLLNVIAARQSNIIKRAQLIIQHKLSFFDHAPTTVLQVQEEEEEVENMTGNMVVGATII